MANQSSTPFDQGLFLVHLNRGREHFDRRNFADAAEELEEARRLRPNDDAVLNLLGLAYFKQEKYKDADAVYRKLIELNPESYTLHFNLGLVCFKTGDLDSAEAIFLRALELKPDNQKTHFYLGNIYEKKKQYYNAIFQYRKAGANIMVKRVQEKIDQERPPERAPDEDFTVPTPSPDDTRPSQELLQTEGDGDETNAPDTLEKVNVDHIDRRRFLSALQEGLFQDAPSSSTSGDVAAFQPPSPEAPSPPPEASPPDETSPNVQGPAPSPLPPAASPGPASSDKQEEVLSAQVQSALSESLEKPAAAGAAGQETMPPTDLPSAAPPAMTSRLRLSEPLIPDQSLTDMARDKTPSPPTPELFTETAREGDRRASGARLDIPPAQPLSLGERDHQGYPERIAWGGGPVQDERNVYARMRRRDDIFRYLENNLMEVNFSGKVFIKQGTIYSYSGNLTFWVKPQREESVPPLVIVSGTGKLLLTDRQKDITVMQIEDEEIFVEPSHLLACQETLTPRYAVIERDGSDKPGLHVLMIQGTGVLALSVATSPLLLAVQRDYPVNVSSSSLISWSGDLSPSIIEDEALAEIMLPGPNRGTNLRLEGEGRVLMEKSSG